MAVHTILFDLFASLAFATACGVIFSKNPIHSVIFLILVFCNATGLLLLFKVELIAMMFIIIYVGAIAVLFLFVVMMLNVDEKLTDTINRKKPLITMLIVILFCEIFLITKFSTINYAEMIPQFPTPKDINNTKAIGKILYTDFILPFQISGAILFVAMIGAIVLTMKNEERYIRKQNISKQVSRNKNDTLVIAKVKAGEGIDL